jgi:hypothetical protein
MVFASDWSSDVCSSDLQKINQSIKVSVPASCISTDADGNSLDFNIGRITDVSKEGLAIEIFCSSPFEYISISVLSG